MQKAILTFTDLPAGTCDVTLSFDPPVMGSSKTTPAISLALDAFVRLQQRRADQAKRDAAQAFRRKAIATAHAFDDWSATTGEGLTFSTFVNTFGYQDEDGKQMYEAVKRILDAAHWLAAQADQ